MILMSFKGSQCRTWYMTHLSCSRQLNQQEEIDHRMNGRLALSHSSPHKILSNPAASQRIIVSRVLRATPPNEPADGLGRINDLGCTESCSIRVLSPNVFLCFTLTARVNYAGQLTAFFEHVQAEDINPSTLSCTGNTADTYPDRIAGIGRRHFSITSWATDWCSGFTLSTNVTAWLSIVTSPL